MTITAQPQIICPDWCTISQAEHTAELSDWEGSVIHHSAKSEAEGEVGYSRVASPDGTPDPVEPPHLYFDAPCGMPVDEAVRLALNILEAAKEVRA